MRRDRRVVLSTHLFRWRARRARAHYETLQDMTVFGHDQGANALHELGMTTRDDVLVERAGFERGKWLVVALNGRAV